MAVKNPKKVEKSGREKRFLPVKKTGIRGRNGFHAHFWVSRPKKNTGQGLMVSKSIGDSDIWWQNIAGDKDTWWRNLAGTDGLISLIYQSFRFQHNSRKANIWIFTSFHVASTAISNLYDCVFYLVENLLQEILIFDTKG